MDSKDPVEDGEDEAMAEVEAIMVAEEEDQEDPMEVVRGDRRPTTTTTGIIIIIKINKKGMNSYLIPATISAITTHSNM